MRELRYDTALTAGTWYLWKTGKKRVFFACPDCSGIVLVELDNINEDGTLMTMFSCKRANCSFSDWIRMSGWAAVV